MKWSKFLLPFLVSTAHGAKSVPSDDVSVQVGYHVVFSYPGLQPPTHLFDLIKEGKVGGIILFGENVGSNLSTIVDQFQSTYKESPSYAGTPLLIMTDQEGGEVRRLPGGPDMSAKQVGQSSDPQDAATQAGKDAASALQADHLNTNLAPVLDVYREAGDFDDEYGRSFGNTSSLVSTCGTAFVSAQQSAGVIATAKHFPGLGAAGTDQNTDEEPVTLNLTLKELRSVDEVPFTKAIATGLDMVMHSWALYPALDSKYPSGLSRKWVQGELRGRLGFTGVTITDAIEAGALEAFGTDAERAVLASQAGMDIILASARNVTQGESVVDALVSALNDGTLSEDSFNEATDRILAVRKKL
ncbi:Glycoside hydrolase superfamily [Penicillium riverlandense]|uniref:Glycoside hydrolase superfamily n=1 Tax=Penicillium riverlandense TaxID=1903569 RepID=UPI0025472E1A|nr:Glycoside hydrolase superfamily [Penicillium riverlandense]KAJ5818840.1 Glycoside hydrolase superfamily [Penicillium riverlandense]